MSKLIEVKDLCKVYGEGDVQTKALCGVSFSIEKGEFIAIMGPSGSGKSTLMHLLGFLDKPTSGQYFFNGENTTELTDDETADLRNSNIGFIFQMFNLMNKINVFENVEMPLLYARNKLSKKEIKHRVETALEAVSMMHRVNHFPNQLSGGEKQRVAIARALVNDPDLIFADEPTGNLDSKSGAQVMKILQELNEAGRTIILVTHETYTAQHAKRIIGLKDGNIDSDVNIEKRRFAEDGEMLK